MSKSVISNERECLICKTTQNLHRHHFFGGNPNRKISERHGAWGFFCAPHHNMSGYSVHTDAALRLKWQRKAQEALQIQNDWTTDDFRAVFGRSYL